jgi:hypothetical protein
MDMLPLLKEFGIPTGFCVVLMFAIRKMYLMSTSSSRLHYGDLIKAHTDRIKTLEEIVRKNTEQIQSLNDDRARRADESGRSAKDLALSYAQALKEQRRFMQDNTLVLRELVKEVGRCQHRPHEDPHFTESPFDAVALAARVQDPPSGSESSRYEDTKGRRP